MISATVLFSDLTPRLDAEYYKSEVTEILNKLHNDKRLNQLLEKCNRGKQPIYATYNTGYYSLKTKDVDGYFCRVDELQSVVVSNYLSSSTIQLQPGDVVLNSTGVGSVCRPAIWYSEKKAIVDGHVAILRPISFSSELLYVYLLSDVGQQLLEREVSGGTGQIELYADDIKKIKFPSTLNKLDARVKQLVLQSYREYEESAELNKQAIKILEETLNIPQPKSIQKAFTISFSDLETRFDASYYGPEYVDIQNTIAKYKYEILDSIITDGSTGKAADSYLNEGVPILKVRNVRDGFIDFSNVDHVPDDFTRLYPRAKVKKFDIIITSTGEGSIGKVDWFLADIDCAIVPELTKITPDPNKLWPGYLYLFLRSYGGKGQFMREVSKATGQTHLYIDDYRKKLRIPIIDNAIQKEIHQNMKKSIEKYTSSLKLLDEALGLVNTCLKEYLR